MQQYQLYTFDKNAPEAPRTFPALSDSDALQLAEMIVGDDRAEVWQVTRWIGRINFPDHYPPTAAAATAARVG